MPLLPDFQYVPGAGEASGATDPVGPPAPVVPPPQVADPYDLAAQQVAGSQRAALQASITQATKINPDTQAKTLDLSAKTGLDPALVNRNQGAVSAIAQAQSINVPGLTRAHPDLSKWLSDVNNAAVAHDDVRSLTALDNTLAYLGRERDVTGYLPHGFLWAKDGTIHEPLGDGSTANVYHSLDHLSQELRVRGERELADEVAFQANADRLAKQLGGDLAQGAATLGAGFLTGAQLGLGTQNADQIGDAIRPLAQNNPNVAASFPMAAAQFAGGLVGTAPALIAGTGLGGIGGVADVAETLLQLNRMRAIVSPVVGGRLAKFATDQAKVVAGMEPMNLAQAKQDFDEHGDASHAALNLLISNAVVGAIPASGFGQKLFLRQPGEAAPSLAERAGAQQGYVGASQSLLASIGLQATQGSVQVLANALNDRATLGKPLDVQAIMRDMATNGALGGLMGGAFGLGPAVGAKFHQDAVAAHAGLEFSDALRMGVNTLKNSTLNQRSPESMASAMQTMNQQGIGHVYLDANAWREHWQAQGEDPHAKAEAAGAGQSYREAQATGGEMQVPLHTFMQGAAESKDSDGLVAKARPSPGAPSGEEGHAILSGTPDQIAEQYKTLGETVAKVTTEGSPASDAIHEELLHQLFAAHPGATTEQLDTYAQSVANMFHVLGQRAGVDPQALFRQFPLTITGDAGLIAGHDKVAATMREMLERAKAGEQPSGTDPKLLAAMEDIRKAVTGMGMDLQVHSIDQIQAKLAESMKAQYQAPGQTLEQRGIPVPASGDLGKSSLRAEWRKTHGGRSPNPSDKTWQRLVENAHEVDRATNNPVMRALYDYEAGRTSQVLHQPARGSIEFGDGKFHITLGKNADTSTVFHEMMHMWTEVMGELAQRPETPQQIKDDYQKLLEFSGYGTHDTKLKMQAESLAISNGARGRELTAEEAARVRELNAPHEKLAEAHEAYVMKGESPSDELRGVFAKIKAWMVQVYQSLKGLGVELNPEITGVFDRIHATDEAIAAAGKEQGMDPVFTSAEQSGWGAEKFAAYAKRAAEVREMAKSRAEREAVREFRKTLSADFAAKRKSVTEDVTKEVAERQVYAAIHALQNGEGPHGEPLPETDANGLALGTVKLDRDQLVALYGKDILKELPGPKHERNPGRPVYASEGGMDLGRAAELFGYHGVDQMVRDLRDAPARGEVIKAEVDARMAKLQPDALRDGKLAELAMDALHASKAQSDLEQQEAQALAERVKRQAVPVEMLRATARKLIISRRQRDLNPNQFRVAEAKASREVETALAKGDYDAAFSAKQRKMFNAELFKAAREAKEQTEKLVDYVRDTDKPAARERIGKAGGWKWTIQLPDGSTKEATSQAEAEKISRSYGGAPFRRSSGYLEQMDALKERYEFRPVSLSRLDRRDSLRQWVAKKTAAEEPVAIPEHLLDELGQRNWREATVGELYDVRNTLKNIEKLARLKGRLLNAKRDGTLQDAVDTMATSMGKVGPKRKDDANSKGILSPLTDVAGTFVNKMYRVPDLVRRLDGHETGGAMFDGWSRPLNEAGDHEQVINAEDIDKVHKALDQWGKLSGNNPTTWLNNVALHNREFIPEINEGLSKWTQLMVAYNWGNEGNRERLMEGNQWKAEQVLAIIGRLDAKDKALVEDMWRITSGRRAAIGALEERVHGIAPEWVEATPFANHLGTWSGGYAPIVYDNARSINPHGVSSDEGADLLAARGGAYAMTSHGHAKERQGSQGRPLKLDFSVFTDHLAKVNKDLAWRETLMDANRILNNKTWSDAVIKGVGKGGWDQFYAQLHAIAGADRGIPVGFEKILDYVRQGSNAAMRGFNIAGTLQQLAGLPFVIPRVGVGNFLRALGPAFNPGSHHWVESVSTTMRFRNAERGKMLNEAISRGSILGPLRVFPDTAYMAMNKAWKILDGHAWFASYYKAMGEHGGDEVKARAIADASVAETQGATHTKDTSQALRGTGLAKVFTNNLSWANASFNLMVSSVQRYADRGYRGADAAKMASDMIAYLIVCPAIYLAAKQAITGQSMADWEDPKETAKHLGGEGLYTVLSSMPLLRDAAGAIQGGKRSDGLQGTSGLAALINAGATASHAFQDDKQHRERSGVSPEVKAFVRASGVLFHFPTTQIVHSLDGWNWAEQNGQNPILPTLMGKPPPP